MKRYKFTISYDGTDYSGWQVQPGETSVQARIQESIEQILQQTVVLHGSGRTDQGVHARGQVAHADLEGVEDERYLRRGLNALLPPDIRVTDLRRVPSTFHARRGAVNKEYRYFIYHDDVVPPFLHRYRTHIRYDLDLERMQEAATHLVGTHDFSAYMANPHTEIRTTTRTVGLLKVQKTGPEILIRVQSMGFLYKMVRTISGMLIEVGRGQMTPDQAREALETGVRTAKIPTARPEGLFLWRVYY